MMNEVQNDFVQHLFRPVLIT